MTKSKTPESETKDLKIGEINDDIKLNYQMNEKIINEEYKIWKKTSPLLYDLIYSYSCKSQPLSLKWLEEIEENEESIKAKVLVGSNLKETQNFVSLMDVNLPSSLSNDKQSSGQIPDNLLKHCPLNVIREWNHPGEVNNLQVNQFNKLFTTQTNSGDILLFDLNDEQSKNHKSVLKFHSKEGFGLEWNPNASKQNLLLSSSEDFKIALWDINAKSALLPEIKPTKVISSHENIVNDISWNKSIDSIFASVSDDSSYQIHDLRLSSGSGPFLHITDAHHEPDSQANFSYPINSIEFNNSVSSLFATGGADNNIQIWDLRNPTIPLRRLTGHRDSVIGLKFVDNYLISSSADSRILFWDLNKLNEGEPDKRKSDYFDPCLSFMHGGHTGKICDFDYHPKLDNLMVSCAEDGLVEIWRPAHLGEEYLEEEETIDRDERMEDTDMKDV